MIRQQTDSIQRPPAVWYVDSSVYYSSKYIHEVSIQREGGYSGSPGGVIRGSGYFPIQ